MNLIIDHKPAAIKPGTTIDFISANLLFSDREDFSLTFTLPLRGCKQNRDIFANIYRKDVDINTLHYDAEIIAGRFRASGAVAIVGVDDNDIKLQFISGRSFRNFYVDWDDIYINELDLGSYTTDRSRTPATMWGNGDVIALPWVNNASGNLQNRAEKVNGTWQWHTVKDDDLDTEVVHGLSCQLRLYTLVEKVCQAVDYSFDGAAWVASEFYHLYMLNTLPEAWDTIAWASALPAWSLNEFFSELEKLMLCEFDIDHKNKHVTFSFAEDTESLAGNVAIEEVVDEFEVSIDNEDKSDYHGTTNVGYASCSHEMWPFMSCYWYFKRYPNASVKTYNTLQELMSHLHTSGPSQGRSAGGGGNDQWLIYAADVDTYFVLFRVFKRPTDERTSRKLYGSAYELRPLNRFGDWITDPENYTSKDEIKAVPAWLDLTLDADYNNRGRVVFLDCGSADNTSASGSSHHGSPAMSDDDWNEQQATVDQSSLFTTQRILAGDSERDKSTFDKLYVGFWYGEWNRFGDKLPCPFIDRFEIECSWDYNDIGNSQHSIVGNYTKIESGHPGTLRINNANYNVMASRDAMTKIDGKRKYEFSFLADRLPNVRAHFHIRGKWYLCSELQCEITEHGMNRLVKGTFFRITEE